MGRGGGHGQRPRNSRLLVVFRVGQTVAKEELWMRGHGAKVPHCRLVSGYEQTLKGPSTMDRDVGEQRIAAGSLADGRLLG